MKIYLPILTVVFILVFSTNMKSQFKKDIQAKIEVKDIEGVTHIKALANNNTTIFRALSYQILAVKEGSSGNLTSSEQSGRFTLQPNETKELSEMNINIDKNDALKVFLFFRDEKNNTISKDSLIYNGNKKIAVKEEKKKLQEEDIHIFGLTINETKTKVGGEFYDKLYNYMTLNDLKPTFILKVTEIPTRANSTQIQIFADDSNIYSFIARPDDDYLDSEVQNTVASIEEYFEQKNAKDEGFIY